MRRCSHARQHRTTRCRTSCWQTSFRSWKQGDEPAQQASLTSASLQPRTSARNSLMQDFMMSYSRVPASTDGSMSRLKASPYTSAVRWGRDSQISGVILCIEMCCARVPASAESAR